MRTGLRLRGDHKQLSVLLTTYVLVFFCLAYRRFMVFGWDTGDIGNFHDMFWWTFRGRPFYFAGRGYSNFGLHAEFLWLQLLPIFWLFPSASTLIFCQSVAIGAAGVPVYLIARRLCNDHKTALLLTMAFLLYPPIVSQHVNQVEAPSFIAVYLLFAFYFYLCERFVAFVVFAAIACLGRENVPLAISMFGVWAALQRRHRKWILTPIVFGMLYFTLVTFVVMPWFRPAEVPWDPTARMFSYLGNNPREILVNLLTHPGVVLNHLLSAEIVQYVVLLVQPLAWGLPLFSPASLVALPDLAINTIADNNALRVIAWHYNVITGSALFVGAMCAVARLTRWLHARHGTAPHERVVAACLLLLSTAHWFLWFQPAQYRKMPHHDSLVRAIQAVPRDRSILVPPPLQGHVCGRERWHIIGLFIERPELARTFEYVLLDANERRFPPLVTRDFFDSFYRNPDYELVFAENNVFVFRRKDGGLSVP